MPIHLTTTRRQFLATTAGAFATLGWPCSFYGNETETFAFLSDTHINADPKKRASGVVMADKLQWAVGSVLDLPVLPTALFVNGDLAHLRGETRDYETFLNGMSPVLKKEIPLHLTVGNHDRRDHFCAATSLGSLKQSPVADRLVSMVPTRHVNWFLLDSLRETNETPGALGDDQVTWLGQMLDQHKDKPAVIVAHHNLRGGVTFREGIETVIDVTDRRLTPGGIADSDGLLDTLASRPQVIAYIFGHTHQWNALKWNGIYFLNLPAVAYKFLPEDPTGWVHCTSTPAELKFQLRAFEPKHSRQGETLTIPLVKR